MTHAGVTLIVGNRYGIADKLKIKLEEAGETVSFISEPDFANADKWTNQLDALVGRSERIQNVVCLVDFFQTSSFLETEESQWDEMMFQNVKTPLMISQKTLPIMMKQGYGRFVFLSSPVSKNGKAQAASYAASKGGLLGFTRSLALEGAKSNVRANLVSIPETNDQINAEQIADAILFFLGEESSFITGQEIKTSR